MELKQGGNYDQICRNEVHSVLDHRPSADSGSVAPSVCGCQNSKSSRERHQRPKAKLTYSSGSERALFVSITQRTFQKDRWFRLWTIDSEFIGISVLKVLGNFELLTDLRSHCQGTEGMHSFTHSFMVSPRTQHCQACVQALWRYRWEHQRFCSRRAESLMGIVNK